VRSRPHAHALRSGNRFEHLDRAGDLEVLVARHVEHQHLAAAESTHPGTDQFVAGLVVRQAAEREDRRDDRGEIGHDREPEHRAHREPGVARRSGDARVGGARRGVGRLPIGRQPRVVLGIRHAPRDVGLEPVVGDLGSAPFSVTGTIHQGDRGRDGTTEALRDHLHHRVVLRQVRAVAEQDQRQCLVIAGRHEQQRRWRPVTGEAQGQQRHDMQSSTRVPCRPDRSTRPRADAAEVRRRPRRSERAI